MERLCAFVWWYVTREAEEAERDAFRARLWLPPKVEDVEIPPESPWSAESEMKAFDALRLQTGA